MSAKDAASLVHAQIPNTELPHSSVPFSVRLINIDFKLVNRGPLDRSHCQFLPPGTSLAKAPVIRIFGSTEAGQRVCVHVHQVYPYIYVPYEGDLDPISVQMYIQQLGFSLNHAVARVLNRNPSDSNRNQYVAAIVLVKGIPFYGYHVGWRHYLKIYLVDTSFRNAIVQVLQQGGVMGRSLQPHEAHIPLELQFMIDHNLFGMGMVSFSDVKFRRPFLDKPAGRVYTPRCKVYNNSTVSQQSCWPEDINVPRQSHCELECDALASHILNRERVVERVLHHDFSEVFGPRPTDKLVMSLAALWEDEAQRLKALGKPPVVNPSQIPLDKERPAPGVPPSPWAAEPRIREILDKLVADDAAHPDAPSLADRLRFPKQKPTEGVVTDDRAEKGVDHDAIEKSTSYPRILTAFQAITALYPAAFTSDKQPAMSQQEAANPTEIDNQQEENAENANFQMGEERGSSSASTSATPSQKSGSMRFLQTPDLDLLVNEDVIKASQLDFSIQEGEDIGSEEEIEADENQEIAESDEISTEIGLSYTAEVPQLTEGYENRRTSGDPFSLSQEEAYLRDCESQLSPYVPTPTGTQPKSKFASRQTSTDSPIFSSPPPRENRNINGNTHSTPSSRPPPKSRVNSYDQETSGIHYTSPPRISQCIYKPTSPTGSVQPLSPPSAVVDDEESVSQPSSTSPTASQLADLPSSTQAYVNTLRSYTCSSTSILASPSELLPSSSPSFELEFGGNHTLSDVQHIENELECPLANSASISEPIAPIPSDSNDPSNIKKRKSSEAGFEEWDPKSKEVRIAQYDGAGDRPFENPKRVKRGTLSFLPSSVVSNQQPEDSASDRNNSISLRRKRTSLPIYNSPTDNLGRSSSPSLSFTRSATEVVSRRKRTDSCSTKLSSTNTEPYTTEQAPSISTTRPRRRATLSASRTLGESASTDLQDEIVDFSSVDTRNRSGTASEVRKPPDTRMESFHPPIPSKPKTMVNHVEITTKPRRKIIRLNLDSPSYADSPITSMDNPSRNKSADGLPGGIMIPPSPSQPSLGTESPPDKSTPFDLPIPKRFSQAIHRPPEAPMPPLRTSPVPRIDTTFRRTFDDMLSSPPYQDTPHFSPPNPVSPTKSPSEPQSLDSPISSSPEITVDPYDPSSEIRDDLQPTSFLLSSSDEDSFDEDIFQEDQEKDNPEPACIPESDPPANAASIEMETEDSREQRMFQRDTANDEQNIFAGPSMHRYAIAPPTLGSLIDSMKEYGIAQVAYRQPYYSDPRDVTYPPKVFSGKIFNVVSDTVQHLPTFRPEDALASVNPTEGSGIQKRSKADDGRKSAKVLDAWKTALIGLDIDTRSSRFWTPSAAPPTRAETEKWLIANSSLREVKDSDPLLKSVGEVDVAAGAEEGRRAALKAVSQIEGPTPLNAYGFKFSQSKTDAVKVEKQHLGVFSLEIHVNTRGSLQPNPNDDPVVALFTCWLSEEEDELTNGHRPGYCIGIIALKDTCLPQTGIRGYDIELCETEEDMITALIEKVRSLDPDILTGFEIHSSSWGYVTERASSAYGINLVDELSRICVPSDARTGRDEDSWGYRHASAFHVTGRHVLNTWRLMRGELNLTAYTYENVVFHVLHERVPKFSHQTLTSWYKHGSFLLKWRVFMYYIERVQGTLKLLEDTEVITRASEFARVFGVDFYAIISRGSQFKVESLMFRLAKPENYILISPSKPQVKEQRALECLPLIMEPASAFYPDPVCVLDFQSLYPSVIIAYNYCYSTCLGRAAIGPGRNKLGVVDNFELQPGVLSLLKDYVNVAPNGLVFVKECVRKSLLAKMLEELLDTRVMIKNAMKEHKQDKALLRLLNARQLSLKYIANVTYGYTSASFSGRMPCADIADAIVQTGRETNEQAIRVVNAKPEWGAKVMYGDTDSMFVWLRGATRERAFQIGHDISSTISKMNPPPVKLKFEKVYHPCVLLAKKRYVGNMYENRPDEEPVFEAKGIEVIRRDGCPAVQKMQETSLKILFRTQNLSEVKSYLQRQFTKILEGKVSLQDFLFAKEIKDLSHYTNLPPGAVVCLKKMAEDPRAEPQYKERIPYLIAHGAPNERLRDQAVSPEDFLNKAARLNGQYYITKAIIPAIARIFNLVGADVHSWFERMPRKYRATRYAETEPAAETETGKGKAGAGRQTIDHFYRSCLVCRELTGNDICTTCESSPQKTSLLLNRNVHRTETRFNALLDVCSSCSSLPRMQSIPCISLDCPVYYERIKTGNQLRVVIEEEKRMRKRWGDDRVEFCKKFGEG